MTIIRKFQMPSAKQESTREKTEDRAGTDLEIPEINTNFIDNLFQDPAFLDRFDSSYEKTNLMGIESEEPRASTETTDGENLLDFDLSPGQRKPS